ncbi:hypothetical protein SAMN05428949_1980 [Chitinophaga sp. YR627]|uniref:hypothetical protein n=1 Tax=Chitinophaga sp. YR627 TaxID=1881041 RepID=UPI0008F0B274|nr:hypothetical protein [Chitinophaga sp. YR627]SFN21859.1 hypothetical protein SAMN05428949_1980 [Chitinophaga sp. YR627]
MVAINILLAIFGLTATLAAFGGDTWIEGEAPLIKRITERVWVLLFCLLAAFVLGITKEIDNYQEQKESKSENKKLLTQLTTLRDSIAATVNDATSQIIGSNCEGLEAAFRLAANIPRECDDCVLNLDGRESTSIPGRKTDLMELYWGDEFEFTFIDGSKYTGQPEDLASIKFKS